MVRKLLLSCGILSSLLYIAMNIFIPLRDADYRVFSQTVSELSAIGAPTRSVWMMWVPVYSVLVLAFGYGIFLSSHTVRVLKIAGILLMIYAVIGFFWPPMHTREVIASGGAALTDTLHIVWTMISVPLMLAVVIFAATAFGKSFRLFSATMILFQILFGILTGTLVDEMETDLPTPWMGIWERIGIAAFMVWVMVFSGILLKRNPSPVI